VPHKFDRSQEGLDAEAFHFDIISLQQFFDKDIHFVPPNVDSRIGSFALFIADNNLPQPQAQSFLDRL
jgi:hypothetical protein